MRGMNQQQRIAVQVAAVAKHIRAMKAEEKKATETTAHELLAQAGWKVCLRTAASRLKAARDMEYLFDDDLTLLTESILLKGEQAAAAKAGRSGAVAALSRVALRWRQQWLDRRDGTDDGAYPNPVVKSLHDDLTAAINDDTVEE